jgi:hypothetical protein
LNNVPDVPTVVRPDEHFDTKPQNAG